MILRLLVSFTCQCYSCYLASGFITTVVTTYLSVTKSCEMLIIFAWKNAKSLDLTLYYIFEHCLNFQKTLKFLSPLNKMFLYFYLMALCSVM